jgi:hypothetical protein
MRYSFYTLLLVTSIFFSTVMQNDSCRSSKTDPKTTSKKSTATTTPSPEARPGSNRLPAGVWGGMHVILEVTDTDANLQFDCAHGVISGPILLDKDGNFDVPGTYVSEGPGPIREGQEQGSKAHYSGTVRDGAMTLKVRLDNSEVKSDFSLALGKSGKIWKCY